MLLDLHFPSVRTCLLALMAALCWPLAAHAAPAVALYYGERAGLADFRAFDLVVVDPVHYRQQPLPAWDGTQFYAYASVTEVKPSRAYYADIPVGWKIGRNPAWGSDLIDQSAPGWPEFFATRVIAPLWAQGYRGFFLDTLDSYRLAERFDEQAQQQGLVQLIRGLHQADMQRLMAARQQQPFSDIADLCRRAGLDLQATRGMEYNPLTRRYWLSADTSVNYLHATRKL